MPDSRSQAPLNSAREISTFSELEVPLLIGICLTAGATGGLAALAMGQSPVAGSASCAGAGVLLWGMAQPAIAVRGGILIYSSLSGIATLIGVAGLIPLLAVFFLVRDYHRLNIRPSLSPLAIISFSILLAIKPDRYTLDILGAFLVALYISQATRIYSLRPIIWGGALGGATWAAQNLASPPEVSVDRIVGSNYEIVRHVVSGVDPNATAGVILLGYVLALYLIETERGLRRILATALAIASIISIILLAARLAMVAALALVVLMIARRLRPSTAITLVGLAVIVVATLLPLFSNYNSFARFGDLLEDAQGRLALYSFWLTQAIADPSHILLGSRTAGLGTNLVAPHNSLLEALVYYGAIGLIAILALIIALLRPYHRPHPMLLAGGIAILIMGGVVGLLSEYCFWLAIALVSGRPTTQASSSAPAPPRTSQTQASSHKYLSA